MKTIKILLPALAFAFALGGAYATTALVQQAWYDANGSAAGGGTFGNITTPSGDEPPCLVQSGSVCEIKIRNIIYFPYDTKEHAEFRGTAGLLKYEKD